MGTTIEVEHVISRLTVEDQTIFDPMMGSGTTGLQRFKIIESSSGWKSDLTNSK